LEKYIESRYRGASDWRKRGEKKRGKEEDIDRDRRDKEER
jgi:hypothetical protein